jgi:hypothetical protein
VNDERRPGRRRSQITRLQPNKRPRRCVTCGAFLSARCELCRGVPDQEVSIEDLARGVAAVDRATRIREDR